jgi:hypothetical protein
VKTQRQDSREYGKLRRQKQKVQKKLDSVNEKGDSHERKEEALGNQMKDLDVDMGGILATIAITDADMKDTVNTVEVL